jgi:hypothetical protein
MIESFRSRGCRAANWLGVGLAGQAKPQACARAGLPRKPLAAFACRGLRLLARLKQDA